MNPNFKTPLAAAALVGAALLPAVAQADALQLQATGTAQVVEVIDPNGPVLRFQSQAAGTGSLGLTGYASTDIVNLGTGQGSGSNRFTTASGDELYGNFTVQVLPGDTPGQLLLQGLTTFTGGTGLFAGATGGAAFTGSGQFISDTQAVVSFFHEGSVSVVPEPGSAALLAAGAAAVAGAATRRRCG